MTLRHYVMLVFLAVGLWLLWVGLHGYFAAWSNTASDLASVKAASQASIHALPAAALGMLFISAATIGLWRDMPRR